MEIKEIIRLALQEDVGTGDHTSMATVPIEAKKKARLLAKDHGILAGLAEACEVFKQVDNSLELCVLMDDGSHVSPGQEVLHVAGPARSILTAERLALNIVQRMSGIATYTAKVVSKLSGLQTKILDTRKTSPLLRTLEKKAVRIGGGFNHRYGLFDMILIKDNHVDFAGGIGQAIVAAKQYLQSANLNLPIEVEVRNLKELEEVIEIGGIQRIMLDNFNPSLLAQAVKIVDGRFETEASGGINIDNVQEYALTGVDFISLGALTHQIKSLDFSLKAF